MNPSPARTPLGPRALVALGLAALTVGLVVEPSRAARGVLLATTVVVWAGLAGATATALYHVCGARWGDRLLRSAHALASLLPWGALGLAAVAVVAPSLYPWADGARSAADPHLSARSDWMSLPFVLGRGLALVAFWTWIAGVVVRRSAAALDGDASARRATVRPAAWFLVLLGPTFSLFAFDWLMSLETHWYSTLYALYHLSGVLWAAAAGLALLALAARRAGRAAFGEEEVHDLGKLVFATSFLWGYLWFCQWMLVWYANLPEETGYFVARHDGVFEPLTVTVVLLGFAIPFAALLSRAGKRSAARVRLVATVVVAARLLDLHLAIAPSAATAAGPLTWWDVPLALGALGAVTWGACRASAGRVPPPASRPPPPAHAPVA